MEIFSGLLFAPGLAIFAPELALFAEIWLSQVGVVQCYYSVTVIIGEIIDSPGPRASLPIHAVLNSNDTPPPLF